LRQVEDMTDEARKLQELNQILDEVQTHYDAEGNVREEFADRNQVLRTGANIIVEGLAQGAFSRAVSVVAGGALLTIGTSVGAPGLQ
jgi:hypothetical protein